ncbi:hypothetical protein TWF718_009917 [Orbilia javanica]|uniref:Uncharacterized protein n=1 Tax=Orbilia javanica TaxID=47235 RepID=A0AAN8MUE3_9PEZI
MYSSASKRVILALLLALEASAYTLSFYSSAGCSGPSQWQHSTTNDSTYITPCEPVPAAAGNSILSAAIAGDATDNHWGYTAQLFSDPACNSQVTTISTDSGCESTGPIRSFVVVGTESNFQMPEGSWDAVSYTVNSVESIEWDAVYNETETEYYQNDNYGDGGGSSSSSSSSSSSITYGSSGAAEPVMYPLDDASLEYATSSIDEAGIPGTVDEAVLDADCGDTIQEKEYLIDGNGDGLADGTLSETVTTNPDGDIVKYEKKKVENGQNFAGPGAIMDGTVVHYDPTSPDRDPREPDPVLDDASSGTLTSTGWPAAVLRRE